MAAAGADGSEARLDGTLRPDNRCGKEVRRVEHTFWSPSASTRSNTIPACGTPMSPERSSISMRSPPTSTTLSAHAELRGDIAETLDRAHPAAVRAAALRRR